MALDDRFISDRCPQSTIHCWTFEIPDLLARSVPLAFVRVVLARKNPPVGGDGCIAFVQGVSCKGNSLGRDRNFRIE